MSATVGIDSDAEKHLDDYCGEEKRKSVVASKAIKNYISDTSEGGE